MRRTLLATALIIMAVAASMAWASPISDKLPKCSMGLCRDVGCSADVLCVSGAHVKNCADVCKGK